MQSEGKSYMIENNLRFRNYKIQKLKYFTFSQFNKEIKMRRHVSNETETNSVKKKNFDFFFLHC